MPESALLIFEGDLEIRRRGSGGRSLFGSFPYGRKATIRDRGRVRKERFRSGAFGWQIREFAKVQQQLADAIGEAVEETIAELKEQVERRNVNLLAGHSFNQPLASLRAGTLKLKDGDDALRFEATLPADELQPTWMKDTVLSVESGLAVGVSPGFRVPPASAVSNAEELIDEPGNPGVQIRQINQAVLYELSIVTRPAYASTSVEARDDDAPPMPAKRRRRRVWL